MPAESISVIGVQLGLDDETVKMVRSSIRKYVWRDKGLAKESVSAARGKVKNYARGWLEDDHGRNGFKYWPSNQLDGKYIYPYNRVPIQHGVEDIITKQIEYKRGNNTRGRVGRARERSHQDYDEDEKHLEGLESDISYTPGTSPEVLPGQSGPSAAAGIRTRALLAKSFLPGSELQVSLETSKDEMRGMPQRPIDIDSMEDARADTAASALQRLNELSNEASGPVETTVDGVKKTVEETRTNSAPAPTLAPQNIPVPVLASAPVQVTPPPCTLPIAMAIGALQPGVREALQMLKQVDDSLEKAKEGVKGFDRHVDLSLVQKMTEFYNTAAEFVAVLAPLTSAS